MKPPNSLEWDRGLFFGTRKYYAVPQESRLRPEEMSSSGNGSHTKRHRLFMSVQSLILGRYSRRPASEVDSLTKPTINSATAATIRGSGAHLSAHSPVSMQDGAPLKIEAQRIRNSFQTFFAPGSKLVRGLRIPSDYVFGFRAVFSYLFTMAELGASFDVRAIVLNALQEAASESAYEHWLPCTSEHPTA